MNYRILRCAYLGVTPFDRSILGHIQSLTDDNNDSKGKSKIVCNCRAVLRFFLPCARVMGARYAWRMHGHGMLCCVAYVGMYVACTSKVYAK